ncbi:glucose-6-phosphate 1-dehydrogenase [Sphingomonas jatrophae]|uniref:Glucose-6-phosphate 1-dehydrogenase n=1 Tax=Sphingomonas jatrophae TaxID=1166337 RepID=A0A1I6K1X9_9SPHN|nr:glucose-6-phosphate 1-dehydrogenase [Sphingomonas jatrophae]
MPPSSDAVLPPATLVIFGATGDLTARLLMPALTTLRRQGYLDDGHGVLGIGHSEGDATMLRDKLDAFRAEKGGEGDADKDAAWSALLDQVDYLSGDFEDDALYASLAERIEGNVVFYLAVPPKFFAPIVEKLASCGLTKESDAGWRRIIIEKPFGHDLESAAALNARLLACVPETQLYRIDHFLGKETVQNIVVARFANTIIEKIWNSDCIDSVQITAAETVDVGTRGSFYDATGALRDMVPNHLFQILATLAMEPPASFDAESVRDEKAKVLRAIRLYDPAEAAENSVRGRYGAGRIGDRTIPAYRDTPDVAADSRTETYAALKLMVDSWRWAGVPFYLRTGKALTARDTEVVVTFRQVPFAHFPRTRGADLPANRIVFQIQPDEGIDMDVSIKQPGPEVATEGATLAYRYPRSADLAHLTGYESLLHDVLTGDQSLFQRADAIEAGWRAVQPFLDAWRESEPETYEPGGTGPAAADRLIERDGRRWHSIARPEG